MKTIAEEIAGGCRGEHIVPGVGEIDVRSNLRGEVLQQAEQAAAGGGKADGVRALKQRRVHGNGDGARQEGGDQAGLPALLRLLPQNRAWPSTMVSLSVPR